MANELTKVLFRAERSGIFKGQVTAVFPEEGQGNWQFACYAHVGQHGSCSREWYATTRPATPDEYASLKAELENYGPPDVHYNLKVIKRWPATA